MKLVAAALGLVWPGRRIGEEERPLDVYSNFSEIEDRGKIPALRRAFGANGGVGAMHEILSCLLRKRCWFTNSQGQTSSVRSSAVIYIIGIGIQYLLSLSPKQYKFACFIIYSYFRSTIRALRGGVDVPGVGTIGFVAIITY